MTVGEHWSQMTVGEHWSQMTMQTDENEKGLEVFDSIGDLTAQAYFEAREVSEDPIGLIRDMVYRMAADLDPDVIARGGWERRRNPLRIVEEDDE